jgi:ankyrin repeat protein
MKFKTLTLLFLCVAAGTLPISAADTLQQTFQKGLFEEEGNQNLTAAIQAYESVLSQLDQQRKIAATTVFRLGECYRKLGKTNEATVQYQRVVREFADQEILTKLSQQNLMALSAADKTSKTTVTLPTPSGEAAQIEGIKRIIKDSPDLINALLNGNLTRLHEAASQGQLVMAEFLLANNADIHAKAQNRRTALHFAAENGHKTMVELLLAHKADVNAKDNGLVTPLHRAVEKGFRAVAEVLIAARADLNAVSQDASDPFSTGSPLYWAVKRGDSAMMEMLINRGADVNIANRYGVTPLHFAASGGHPEASAILLQKGASVNATLTGQFNIFGPSGAANLADGATPLHLAAAKGNKDLVELLLEHKAKVNARGAYEKTALNLAAEFGTTEVVRLLLEHGADINNLETANSSVPLHNAVARRLRDMVEVILAHKPRLELRNSSHWTPLQAAVERGNVGIVEILLQAGADPNATINNGITPLHEAVQSRNKQMVELLLRHKANVLAVDSSGRTPLDNTVAGQSQPVRLGPGVTTTRPVVQGQDAVLSEIADLLKKASAKDEGSQRFSMILIGRDDAYYPGFSKGTNELNRHTLFELIASVYRDQSSFTRARGRGGLQSGFPPQMAVSLAFPDFSRIVIHRAERGGDKEIQVDLTNVFPAADCSKDIGLEWGDKVEIPETDHKLNERWEGLSVEASQTLGNCLRRTVRVVVKGQFTDIILDPFVPNRLGAGSRSTFQSRLEQIVGPPSTEFESRVAEILKGTSGTAPTGTNVVVGSFRLNEVLREANVLRTSSDINRVKVKRVDPATKQTQEMLFNLEQSDPKTDLWLRDGDVIEVPEKE